MDQGYVVIDVEGPSGKVVVSWKPSLSQILFSLLLLGILVDLEDKDMGISFQFINVYRPYLDNKPYQDSLMSIGFFATTNVILGGDLNLTIYVTEVWGSHSFQDPLGGYFKRLFKYLHLVDLAPSKLSHVIPIPIGVLQNFFVTSYMSKVFTL